MRPCPGGGAQLPQFLEALTGHFHTDPKGGPAQHGAPGDAHGWPVGVTSGQSVGDLAGALPTQARRGDVAVGGPCCGAHVPAERGVEITGGLEMFGNKGGESAEVEQHTGLVVLCPAVMAPVKDG